MTTPAEDVRGIREDFAVLHANPATGLGVIYRRLAREYGVSARTVERIVHKHTRAGVE